MGRAQMTAFVRTLWSSKVHELRDVGSRLLAMRAALLEPADLPLLETFLAGGAEPAVLDRLARDVLGAMAIRAKKVWKDLRKLAALPATRSWVEVVAHPAVKAWLQQLLDGLAQQSTGSANRLARALIITEPPSLDLGEVTDKGSINQRAVLKHRAALVEALHDGGAEHIAKLRPGATGKTASP
jgi:feruloyl-CoA synthase